MCEVFVTSYTSITGFGPIASLETARSAVLESPFIDVQGPLNLVSVMAKKKVMPMMIVKTTPAPFLAKLGFICDTRDRFLSIAGVPGVSVRKIVRHSGQIRTGLHRSNSFL
jgi:hypothetical protein